MNSWSGYTQEEGQLARLLNTLALILLALGLLTLITPYLFPDAPLFIAPPYFVSNTIAGMILMAFLAWCAAADVRRFRAMIYVLIGGFLIGAAAFLAMYLRPIDQTQEAPLLLGFAVCLVSALLVTGFLLRGKPAAPPWLPWIPEKPLTNWEKIARVVFGLFGLGSLGAAAASILLPYLGITLLASILVNPFMIAGSTIKIAVLGLCSLLVALDIRRYTHYTQMITALVIGHTGSLIVITLLWRLGFARFGEYTLMIGDTAINRELAMFGAWALDVVIITAFLFIQSRVNGSLLDHIGFLSPSQFRGMESIAESLVTGGEAEAVPPYQIVLRTDSYLKAFRSERLGLARLAIMGLQLSPLAWLHPPLNYLHPAARQEFVDTRFKTEIITPSPAYRLLDDIVRRLNQFQLRLRGRPAEEAGAALGFFGLLEGMMRFNMQLTYMGYYNNPVVWPKQPDGNGLGYVPFSQRSKDFPVIPRRPYPPLKVTTPDILEREGIDVISDADVVIVGSGAAGAILAEQMLEQGRRVLMLEKGLYVHPDNFSEDEIDMISRLYSDGALQISQALRFSVLQGSCVGGTTVVNNAVCFDTPQRVLDSWNSRGPTPVIDSSKFHASQKFVRERMHIHPISAVTRQPLDGGVLNHGDSMVTAAVEQYFKDRSDGHNYNVVEANIVDCLGCGYCNIGCKYGRKLSMLDEVLPSAQQKYGSDRFQILSEAEVVKLEEHNGKIIQLVAEIQGKRKLFVSNPKTVILSAGTIASSWLMMQSGIGKKNHLPVGQGLSFNMGSPIHALFEQELNSFDGLQIAHYLTLEDHPGFVYET